jgi:hypothetical protein
MNKLHLIALLFIFLTSCSKDEGLSLTQPIEHFDFDENSLASVTNQTVMYPVGQNDQFLVLHGYTDSPLTSDRKNKLGSAVSMDGENDYFSADTYSVDMNNSRQLSLAIWLWVDAEVEPQDAPIFSVYDGNYYQMLYLENGALQAAFNNGIVNINEPIEAGRWNHIVLTFQMDDPYEFRLYINGEHRQSGDFSGLGFATGNWQNLQIGNSVQYETYLAGNIDDLKIYNTTLSAKEIKALYSSEKP